MCFVYGWVCVIYGLCGMVVFVALLCDYVGDYLWVLVFIVSGLVLMELAIFDVLMGLVTWLVF